eukprot:m.401137 g.401137  ORF g.401137 m.401137 type:complete len:462 (-) comp20115_c6_seq1:286-1671(-)
MASAHEQQALLGQDQHQHGEHGLHRNSGAIKLYKSRWLMLLVIFILQISNAMVWVTFAPIASIARDFYNTTTLVVNLQSLLFMFVFFPVAVVSSWCLEHKGLRFSVNAAAWLNAIGALVRALSSYAPHHYQLVIVIVGQTLAAVAQPVILGCPTFLVAIWFGEKERAEANTIATASNPLGMAIGSVLAPQLVSSGTDLRLMYYVFCGPAFLGLLMSLLFLKDKPPTPPSVSAGDTPESWLVGLKHLWTNKQFILLVFSFGMGIGLTSANTTLLGQIVGSVGYSADDSGYFSAFFVGFGLFGAGLAGVFVDKTKWFLTTYRICIVGASASFVFFTFMVKRDNWAMLAFANSVMGFFCFAALPVALELCVECTFPIHEGTSGEMVWASGQIFGIIAIFGMDALKGEVQENTDDYRAMDNSLWFMVGLGAVSLVAGLLFNTEYKRLKEDHGRGEAARSVNTTAP